MVKVEATGNTIADALKVFGPNLEAADTDVLIAELRGRLATQKPPHVLRIIPFTEVQEPRRTR